MANRFIGTLKSLTGWFVGEHIKDYREGKALIYDGIIKTSTQINQIILTVSVASLAAVAALNKAVFVPYGFLSFSVITLFILVMLLSVINLYISTIVLRDMQNQFNKNWKSLSRLNKDMEKPRFRKIQKTLNTLVFGGFCLGLVTFLMLLGFYILGGNI